jgi:hypothetical protein
MYSEDTWRIIRQGFGSNTGTEEENKKKLSEYIIN